MSVRAVVKKAGKNKRGRGFSRDELRRAGIDFYRALKLRLPIDKRRKTRHTENVKALKRFVQKNRL